jgi:N-acyl amino acid synthase of PEP-CTERM/exosortase system
MSKRVHFLCDRQDPTHYFEFAPLDESAALAESYAIRFQVYCRERAFLPEAAYPDERESDTYDARASHFGGFYRDGSLAGTVRLVHGPLDTLPLQSKCTVDPATLPADAASARVAEISRLAVSKAFRRRVTDDVLPGMNDGPEQPAAHPQRRRNCPELVLGLYKILYHETKRQRIDYWFAAMESSLAKLLNRFHFEFRPIGPEIDYYGPVRPYVASLSHLEVEVLKHCPDLFWSFMEGLEPEHLPPAARG